MKNHKENAKLPGLEKFNSHQIFFLAFAKVRKDYVLIKRIVSFGVGICLKLGDTKRNRRLMVVIEMSDIKKNILKFLNIFEVNLRITIHF